MARGRYFYAMGAKTSLQDEWGQYTVVPNEFIQNSADLSDHARWIFVLLRFHTNDKTKTAFPSYELLKQETGWAYNTIAKAIKQLEEKGWLTRRKQFSGNTHYTLTRQPVLANDQSLPETSNDQSLRMTRTSQNDSQSLPIARPVLANSKATKTEITKTEITKTESSASQKQDDPLYKLFCEVFEDSRQIPYLHKKHDFIQLAELRKKCKGKNWELTVDRFSRAMRNYFASDLSSFTLANLCAKFSDFYSSAVDRYGKSVQSTNQSSQFTAKTQSNVAAANAFLAKHGFNGGNS